MSAPAIPSRTQRWREKSVLYRPAGEEGFDPRRYDVMEIPKATSKTFTTMHHYTGAFPQTRFQFGLFDTHTDNAAELVGSRPFDPESVMAQRIARHPDGHVPEG